MKRQSWSGNRVIPDASFVLESIMNMIPRFFFRTSIYKTSRPKRIPLSRAILALPTAKLSLEIMSFEISLLICYLILLPRDKPDHRAPSRGVRVEQKRARWRESIMFIFIN